MLNKIKEQVDEIESTSEEIKAKLDGNLGMLPIYREIIASNRRMQTISIITIVFLSILLIVNLAVTIHNEYTFNKYRENSISKQELITILESFVEEWYCMKKFEYSKSEYETVCEECMLNEEERIVLKLRCQGKSRQEMLNFFEDLNKPMSNATLGRIIIKIDKKIKRWC